MQVMWTYSTNWSSKRPEERQTWDHEFRILRPKAEVEVRSEVNWLDLLNELGHDGWELVSEGVRRTTVMGHAQGWTDVGSPIGITWTFKRAFETSV
jgi:hypothetical protein